MALPASGEIKLSDIGAEFSAANLDLSLGGLEGNIYGAINTASPSYPDGLQPNEFSEWYSYDHNASSNAYYYNTGSNRITYNSGNNFPDNPSSSFSISLWVAPRWSGGSGAPHATCHAHGSGQAGARRSSARNSFFMLTLGFNCALWSPIWLRLGILVGHKIGPGRPKLDQKSFQIQAAATYLPETAPRGPKTAHGPRGPCSEAPPPSRALM